MFRHIFEKQKADENERAAKRMMEKPGGRRHDAFTDYHQRIQMGDEVHGYEAEAVSATTALTIMCSSCAQRMTAMWNSLLEKLLSCLQYMAMA